LPYDKKTVDAWDLMAEAEELRKKWQAAMDECVAAQEEGRAIAEIAKLDSAQERLKDAYLAKGKEAVAASLAERKE
jgi:hypothetical protein